MFWRISEDWLWICEKLLESYTESIVDAGMYKDGVYGVPIMLDTRFGVARMDLFEEVGYTEPPKKTG